MGAEVPDKTLPPAVISDGMLREFCGYTMKRAFHVIQTDVNRTLAPFGLRMVTFSALAVIVENPGLRQSHLADALLIERPNLVLILDDLQRLGLIARNPAADDRRAYALTPTDAGKELFARARAAVRAHDARMTAELGDAEKADLISALRRIERVSEQEM